MNVFIGDELRPTASYWITWNGHAIDVCWLLKQRIDEIWQFCQFLILTNDAANRIRLTTITRTWKNSMNGRWAIISNSINFFETIHIPLIRLNKCSNWRMKAKHYDSISGIIHEITFHINWWWYEYRFDVVHYHQQMKIKFTIEWEKSGKWSWFDDSNRMELNPAGFIDQISWISDSQGQWSRKDTANDGISVWW